MSKYILLFFLLFSSKLYSQGSLEGDSPRAFLFCTKNNSATSCEALNSARINYNASKSKLKYPDFIAFLPKVKYEFGAAQCWSIGLSTIDYEGDDILVIPAWRYNGPLVETGLATKDQKQYMCNKIGYEYFILCLGGRANLVHYTDFSTNQFYFRPEVGASLFSVVTFTYGYNVNLSPKTISNFDGSIFSLNLAWFINKKEYRTKK